MSIGVSPQTVVDDEAIIYPESDGMPMADNTLQFEWIVRIKTNLDALFRDDPNVFVAGDHLWYPVKGSPDIRRAPDAMVIFGRPKGHRGSYRQWVEGGIAPQVVFEVLSPGNTREEMREKLTFYDRYGVEEYYLYDPDHNMVQGWLRQGGRLRKIASMDGWESPRLHIRFVPAPDELCIYRPDGQMFQTFEELDERVEDAERDAEQARKDAEQARFYAREMEARLERLLAQLRERGIDPETLA